MYIYQCKGPYIVACTHIYTYISQYHIYIHISIFVLFDYLINRLMEKKKKRERKSDCVCVCVCWLLDKSYLYRLAIYI